MPATSGRVERVMGVLGMWGRIDDWVEDEHVSFCLCIISPRGLARRVRLTTFLSFARDFALVKNPHRLLMSLRATDINRHQKRLKVNRKNEDSQKFS